MVEKVCELCGTKLTTWNTAWGTRKCNRCAKGKSSEAKKYLELKDLTKTEIRDIAVAQKLVMVALLVHLIAIIVIIVAAAYASLDLRILGFATSIFNIITIYRLARALRRPDTLMWAVMALLLWGIPLLVLSLKASKVLKAAGVRVGLLGARLKEMA